MQKIYKNNGFVLIREKEIPELEAKGLLFYHVKSGARLFKLDTDDDNNTFCISFKTIPVNDSGIPHILEHSVLNGSEKFPGRSPFTTLLQGSMQTFLNALTGKDRTLYPVASRNRKDFFNLINVYMDAVFNPMIYKNPMIFRQEGWHISFNSEDEAEYNGVVYSEMKGAFSSPSTIHSKYIYKSLFPNTSYGTVSGGYPEDILKLEESSFLNFHRKFYHPSNSYIFIYGNGELEEELNFLDREYLSEFRKSEDSENIEIPTEESFIEPVSSRGFYPLASGEKLENKSLFSISWACNPKPEDVMGLDMLSILLNNMPSSPLKKAIIDSGCGDDTYSSFSQLKQSVFNIIVKNGSEDKFDEFRNIVEGTLKKVAIEGFNRSAVEGLINRYTFDLKEGEAGSFPKAIEYCYSMLSSWFYFDDPFDGLEFKEKLNNINNKYREGYFEQLLSDYLIKNNHKSHVLLSPQTKPLNSTRAKPELSAKNRNILKKQYNELLEYQNNPESEEVISKVPMLSIKDLPEVPLYHAPQVLSSKEIEYHTNTGGIIYLRLMFDASGLDHQLTTYMPILVELLGELDTSRRSYSELDTEININTGGISFFNNIFLRNSNPNKFTPYFTLSSKIIPEKTEKFFKIAEEIIFHTILTDSQRIKELCIRLLSRLEGTIRSNGYSVGNSIFEAELGSAYVYREVIEGLKFHKFLKNLIESFDRDSEYHIDKLKEVASKLFTQNNMVTFVTASESHCSRFRPPMESFRKKLPKQNFQPSPLLLPFKERSIGLKTASQVQYVFRGYNYFKLGYHYNGVIPLLSQIIGKDYLHRKIRVNGGAYGAGSILKRTGFAYFFSYRDPNLESTVESIDGISDYLRELKLSEKDLTRFKIGTVASLDKHMTPKEKGKSALINFFRQTSLEELIAERGQLLEAENSTLRHLWEMFSKIKNHSITTVYGGSETIDRVESMFDELIPLLNE